jgi:molybdopterin synthase sulfur carrier subunit
MATPSESPAIATVTVFVPGVLRPYSGGRGEIPIAASTVLEALEALERQYPDLHRNVRDETGAVRRHINVFVNSDHMRDREGLDTRLSPGDVVTILPAVSGG